MDLIKELIKISMALCIYFGVGPALGFILKGREKAQCWVIGFWAWWLVRPISDFTLMLNSIEKYRGHTKGFEINFMDAIAIGLALAAVLEKRRDFKWLPPTLLTWFLWVFVCTISVVSAVEPVYALMPAVKFGKMSLVIIGIFAAVHGERQILALMRGFAIALILQIWICLWGRYVGGGFRVMGWFEHQNPMAIWSYSLAFPLMGLILTRGLHPRDLILFCTGYASAGLAVLLSVSRASLAAFAIGSALVFGISLLQGIKLRHLILGIGGGLGGLLAVAMAADTFMERMHEDADPTDNLRIALNAQSKSMLDDHPALGIGWNQFGLMNSRPLGKKYSKILEDWEAARGRNVYPEQFKANPLTESLYWLILAENGYLGFAAFLLFLAHTIWLSLRATAGHWQGPLGLFLLGITVSLFILYLHGKVERVLTQTKNLWTWIMLTSIAAKCYWLHVQQIRQQIRQQKRLRK